MAVNDVPLFVEWKSPLSVDTQTSPVTPGLTTILTGDVDEPNDPFTVKVLPVSVER